MPTKITQIEDRERDRIVLRVEGELTAEDAYLLEKIAVSMRAETGKAVAIDLADLHFLDSESAPVLRRIEREHRFAIEGLMIFLQRTVEETEKSR